MLCDKCINSLYLQAISFGKCKICGRDIYCPHLPCYDLCDKCSDENSYCQQCGYVIDIESE